MYTVSEEYISTRKLPINLKEGELPLFVSEQERILSPVQIFEIKKAFILNDIILDLRHLRLFIKGYTHVQTISRKSILRNLSILFRKGIIVKEAVWIINNWSKGYFHWLTDALPRLMASEAVYNNYPILLPEEFRRISYVEQSLTLLNKEIIYYSPKLKMQIESLLLPEHTAPSGNYNHIFIHTLRNRLLPKSSTNAHRKIYISRKKAIRRNITNEAAVQELLVKYGYEIHHFEDYSFYQQIEIMSSTKELISLHGSGLTNMLFMPIGNKVLEFRNRYDKTNNCYFTLASELKHQYYYQLCDSNTPQILFADITIDLSLLKQNIELMLAS